MLFCLFCIYVEATGVGWGARVREWGVGAHPIGGFGRRAFVDGTAAVSRSGLFELGQSEHLGDCWHGKCVSSASNAFRSAEIRQAPKAILEIIIIIIIVIIIIIFVPGAYVAEFRVGCDREGKREEREEIERERGRDRV